MGCHGNHSFNIARIIFSWGQFFGMTGVQMNTLTPMESCPGVAR